jgi:hypothetical protein
MKVFIGHDSRQELNSQVCASSLGRYNIDFEFIDLKKMGRLGYRREEDGSTEFAYTRFLVPYLSQYKGVALFCDSDFVWRYSPAGLEQYVKDHPVACVQHPKMEVRSDFKFKDNKNEWYPKKWWSSLMMFDCSSPDIVKNLTLENINNKPASWLHRMEWAASIGNIPREYNHLVGYYPYDKNAIGVHFTDGSPMYHQYKKEDYANDYLALTGF